MSAEVARSTSTVTQGKSTSLVRKTELLVDFGSPTQALKRVSGSIALVTEGGRVEKGVEAFSGIVLSQRVPTGTPGIKSSQFQL